jgi:hypothetical protein
MTTYSYNDVLTYFKKNVGVQKSRKREYLDKRNYVISVLYYEFKYTEEELGYLFKIDRSSVSHAKNISFHLAQAKEEQYLKNVKELTENFPCLFPDNDKKRVPERCYTVVVNLTKSEKDKLILYAAGKEKHINSVARDLIIDKLNGFIKN